MTHLERVQCFETVLFPILTKPDTHPRVTIELNPEWLPPGASSAPVFWSRLTLWWTSIGFGRHNVYLSFVALCPYLPGTKQGFGSEIQFYWTWNAFRSRTLTGNYQVDRPGNNRCVPHFGSLLLHNWIKPRTISIANARNDWEVVKYLLSQSFRK